MTTQVNFKLAKSIQDKGFEETTQKWYSTEGNHYYQDEFSNNRGSVPSYCCEAPTITEVCMWLYEKHGIWISTELYDKGRFKYIIIEESSISKRINPNFNSPTEAYEAAIKYVLENLI